MKKGLIVFIAIFALAIGTPGSAFAQSDVWEMADSGQYGKKAAGMVGRGFLNVATSPVDLIVQTVEGTQEGPPVVGTLTGLGSGVGCTLLRASSGIVDVATFWVPGFNGFRISRSYSNCLEELAQRPMRAAPAPTRTVAAQPASYQQGPAQPVRAQETGHDPMRYVKKGKKQSHDPMDYVKKGKGQTRSPSGQDRSAYIK